MADFNFIINRIFISEGGESNDAVDRGGLTKYGISQKSYPDLNIRGLTRQQAIDIYRRDFWDRLRGDEIPNDRVGYMLMDMAVNMGIIAAVREFQTAINYAGRVMMSLPEKWQNIVVDGIIGRRTIEALQLCAPDPICDYLLRARCLRYAQIIRDNPSQAKFAVGWIKRAFETWGMG